MSLETNWYLYRGQQRWGPYTWQQLQEMVQGGQIGPGDQLWHSQYPNKISANQMKGLSELFASKGSAAQEIPSSMVTTALELPGWSITHSFGIVQSFIAIAYGPGTPISAISTGFQGAVAGPVQQAIGEAYKSLLQIATQYGANAIIGFRFTIYQVGCLAYGTAVLVETNEKGKD